mmetsp:Transcript_4129/g.15418  ORF Transcript_4129/g.15418 Transcript_4129/m.15418 type:complete len:269 (-) Transcript_4129:73-879(-)
MPLKQACHSERQRLLGNLKLLRIFRTPEIILEILENDPSVIIDLWTASHLCTSNVLGPRAPRLNNACLSYSSVHADPAHGLRRATCKTQQTQNTKRSRESRHELAVLGYVEVPTNRVHRGNQVIVADHRHDVEHVQDQGPPVIRSGVRRPTAWNCLRKPGGRLGRDDAPWVGVQLQRRAASIADLDGTTAARAVHEAERHTGAQAEQPEAERGGRRCCGVAATPRWHLPLPFLGRLASPAGACTSPHGPAHLGGNSTRAGHGCARGLS